MINFKVASKTTYKQGEITPVTHLFSAIYKGYTVIPLLTARGPPCRNGLFQVPKLPKTCGLICWIWVSLGGHMTNKKQAQRLVGIQPQRFMVTCL